ncbi:MAG: ABC transporter ATP-binding protein [Bdellovibrionales bacterium]|nr:ABC transporter ATP-binding protein [Bdellovibrionales bacterium]
MDLGIEVRGVQHKFKSSKGIQHLNFNLRQGQCLSVVGSFGSGKSTTLRLLAGNLAPSTGEIFILGFNSKINAKEIKCSVGFMPEQNGFDYELSAMDNLVIYGSYFNFSQPQVRTRARHLLRLLQLDEFNHSPVSMLSGSQQRRLALALALLIDPKVLILDMPTHGLSLFEKKWLWKLIGEQIGNRRITIIASNDLNEVEKISDEVIILHKGKVVSQGSPRELIQNSVGKKVVEYNVPDHDLEYHLRALEKKYQYQILAQKLKIFIPEHVDAMTTLRWVPSETVVYRDACLSDVFTKVVGYDLED